VKIVEVPEYPASTTPGSKFSWFVFYSLFIPILTAHTRSRSLTRAMQGCWKIS
jgi:hypothetical protein